VLTNADDGDPPFFSEKAFEWVAPAILKAVAPAAEAPEPDTAAQRYMGKYRSTWGDSQVLLYDGDLVLIAPSLPDPTLAMTTLIPVAEHTFRIESKDGFTSRGELVVFEMNEDDRVQRVKMGENYSLPVSEW
jgi:hypothetical protein